MHQLLGWLAFVAFVSVLLLGAYAPQVVGWLIWTKLIRRRK